MFIMQASIFGYLRKISSEIIKTAKSDTVTSWKNAVVSSCFQWLVSSGIIRGDLAMPPMLSPYWRALL